MLLVGVVYLFVHWLRIHDGSNNLLPAPANAYAGFFAKATMTEGGESKSNEPGKTSSQLTTDATAIAADDTSRTESSARRNATLEAWPCTWPECRPAAVTLTFDDGRWSAIELAARLLSAHGLQASFYIVTDRIGNRGEKYLNQLEKLMDQGNEIGAHTVSHVHLLNRTYPEQRHENYVHEIAGSAAGLRKAFGSRLQNSSLSFAYPFGSGSHSRSVKMEVGKHFLVARGLDMDMNWSQSTRNLLNVRTVTWVTKTTAVQMLRWMTTALRAGETSVKHGVAQTRSWLVISGHGVRPANSSNSSALPTDHFEEGYEPALEMELKRFLRQLQLRTQSKQLWVAPLGNVSRFMVTRDSITQVTGKILLEGYPEQICASKSGQYSPICKILLKNRSVLKSSSHQSQSADDVSTLDSSKNLMCRLLQIKLAVNKSQLALPDPHLISVRTSLPLPRNSTCYAKLRKMVKAAGLRLMPGAFHSSVLNSSQSTMLPHCIILPDAAGKMQLNSCHAQPSCWCQAELDWDNRLAWICTMNNISIMIATHGVASDPPVLHRMTLRVVACYRNDDCFMASQPLTSF